MIARHADTMEEATHRYITHVRWGRGYFGDLYRYIVASSEDDAFKFALANSGTVSSPDDVKKLPSTAETFK